MNVMLRHSCETHEVAPVLVYTKDFYRTMGFVPEDGDWWALGWEIHVRPTKLPNFGVWKQVFENMDIWMLGREIHETPKAAPISGYREEFEWSMSFVSEKIVDIEGIRSKELPSWFFFSFHLLLVK